jgi:FlaA1/EpsC-like NDP-sugar epimerase
MNLDGKRVLVTGGTGSLGKVLVRRIFSGEIGTPEKVTVFSRDEAKQHDMRLDYLHRRVATDEVIYENSQRRLAFRVGDVRDYSDVLQAMWECDVVFNAAALKQVPTCEYFPYQAVLTNVVGPQNIVRAVKENGTSVELVVGISTDKACKPVNVMGMTKALQERIFIQANLEFERTRFVCVRYGNVLASRGSVVPLFLDQIARGGPVTITLPTMTRFLLSLDRAVDTIFAAVREGSAGETYVPIVDSAYVTDIADVLIGGRSIETMVVGIRPGEKVHEIMVSEEECYRTGRNGEHYVIRPLFPELQQSIQESVLGKEYSSADRLVDRGRVRELLTEFVASNVRTD